MNNVFNSIFSFKNVGVYVILLKLSLIFILHLLYINIMCYFYIRAKKHLCCTIRKFYVSCRIKLFQVFYKTISINYTYIYQNYQNLYTKNREITNAHCNSILKILNKNISLSNVNWNLSQIASLFDLSLKSITVGYGKDGDDHVFWIWNFFGNEKFKYGRNVPLYNSARRRQGILHYSIR